MRDAIALIGLLDDGNAQAFLRMIRAGEGTAGEDGYRVMFGGAHIAGLDGVPGTMDDFADHPRKVIVRAMKGKSYTSTAAGAYQFLSRTWDECAAALGLRDFSPRNQDIAALFLVDRRKALDDVLAGRFDDAVRKCNREWASLPGSPYGQPVKTMAQAEQVYREHGGAMRQQSAPALLDVPEMSAETINVAPDGSAEPTQPQPVHLKEPTMPLPLLPLLGLVLPNLVAAIPQLGKLFGSGSAVAERNIKAAELAVTIVQEAVGARNAQEAAEMVASDPAAAQAATAAVEQRWFELSESGGGGIEGARKADAASRAAGDMLESPSFWIACALLLLVFWIMGNVMGLYGAAMDEKVRSAIINGAIGMILGGIVGYYFGQTTSRNRTPQP